MEAEQALSPIVSEAQFYILSIYFLIPVNVLITVLGIASNAINIVVFVRMSPVDTMTMSLTALAVSDLMYSCFSLFYYIISALIFSGFQIILRVDLQSLLIVGFLWQRPLFHKTSALITMFVSCERSLCVVRPFLVKQIFTKKFCMAAMVIIYSSITIIFMPVYVNGRLAWTSSPNATEESTVLVAYFTAQRAAAETVVHIGAGLTLIVFTQTIIIISSILMTLGLRRHQVFRQSTAHSGETKRDTTKNKAVLKSEKGASQACDESNNDSSAANKMQATSTKEDRLIKTVLILAIMHIVLNSPLLAYYGVYQTVPEFRGYRLYKNLFMVTTDVVNILEALNGVLNILVYLNQNTKYRLTFKEVFKIC